MGRNPATGEAIKTPAKTVVKMRVAKAAKEAIVPGRKCETSVLGFLPQGLENK